MKHRPSFVVKLSQLCVMTDEQGDSSAEIDILIGLVGTGCREKKEFESTFQSLQAGDVRYFIPVVD